MAIEFLIPQKYEGSGCGFTVAISGLDENIEYISFIIYLEGEKSNAVEVFCSASHRIQTTNATFDGLNPNRYYNVIAEINHSNQIKIIKGRILAKIYEGEEISLLSVTEQSSGVISDSATLFSKTTYNPPEQEYINPIYVTIRNQGATETCVAQSLATVMSVLRAKATNFAVYEDYSSDFIYGGDGSDDEGMNIYDAIYACTQHGAPRWELCGTQSGRVDKTQASQFYEEACQNDLIVRHAQNQKFLNFIALDFYDADTVGKYIEDYGCVVIGTACSRFFNSIDQRGIIPNPSGSPPDGEGWHTLVLVGLVRINNEPYWVVQNSWGEGWGNGGRGYLPCDWAYDNDYEWVNAAYAVIPSGTYGFPQPSRPSFLDDPVHIYDYDSGGFDGKLINVRYDVTPSSDTFDILFLGGSQYDGFSLMKQADLSNCKGNKIVGDAKVGAPEYGTYDIMMLGMNENYVCSSHAVSDKSVDVLNLSLDTDAVLTADLLIYEGEKQVVLEYTSLDLDGSSANSQYYARKHNASNGTEDGWYYKSYNGEIQLDNFTTYDFRCVQYSETGKYVIGDIVTFTLFEFLPPTNLITTKGYRKLQFKWDADYRAYWSNLYLKDVNTGEEYNQRSTNHYRNYNDLPFGDTYNISMRLDYSTVDENGDYYGKDESSIHFYDEQYSENVSCKVYIDNGYSPWTFGWDVTVPPAPPVINKVGYDATAQIVSVNYGILDSTYVDKFSFEIYSSDDLSQPLEYIEQTDSETNDVGKSNVVTFNNLYSSGSYVIKARSYRNTVGSILSNGEEYAYITIDLEGLEDNFPTNLSCVRIKKGFEVAWDSVVGATSYNLQILKNDNVVVQSNGLTTPLYTVNTLNYATEYTIQVQSVSSDGTPSAWATLTATTAPACPIIKATSYDTNNVDGTWTLEDPNSNFTYLYVTLYPVEEG